MAHQRAWIRGESMKLGDRALELVARGDALCDRRVRDGLERQRARQLRVAVEALASDPDRQHPRDAHLLEAGAVQELREAHADVGVAAP